MSGVVPENGGEGVSLPREYSPGRSDFIRGCGADHDLSEAETNLMNKNTCFFDLYGTLIDIRTDEKKPSLWRGLARCYSLGGAPYAPSELRECYLALCAEETAALAKKSGLGEDEVEISLCRKGRACFRSTP